MGIKKEELLIGWFQIFIFIPIWIRFDDGLWNLEHQFDPNWILYGDFYFPSYLGEMIQFDRHIFQMGLNHQLVTVLPASFDAHSICASQKPERGWSDNRCRCHSMPTFPPQKKSPSVLSKIPSKKTPKRLKEKNIFPKIPSKNISTDRWNWTPVSFLPGFGFQGEAEFKEQRSRQVAEEQGWCGMTQIDW